MVVGYGATHVPPVTGKHEIEISFFAPNATSLSQLEPAK
jgi:hypothetical protein